jgi:hypothetical protein
MTDFLTRVAARLVGTQDQVVPAPQPRFLPGAAIEDEEAENNAPPDRAVKLAEPAPTETFAPTPLQGTDEPDRKTTTEQTLTEPEPETGVTKVEIPELRPEVQPRSERTVVPDEGRRPLMPASPRAPTEPPPAPDLTLEAEVAARNESPPTAVSKQSKPSAATVVDSTDPTPPDPLGTLVPSRPPKERLDSTPRVPRSRDRSSRKGARPEAPAPQSPSAAPPVQIHIGTIEVRAVPAVPAAPAPRRAERSEPALTLEAYAERRRGGR